MKSSQVEKYGLDPAGSHRFPANCRWPYPRPVPVSVSGLFPVNSGARKWWPYMAAVSGTVPECGFDWFFPETGYGSYPLGYRMRIRLFFYGGRIRIVYCQLQNPNLIIKYNLEISIPCFDFVSSHTDPSRHELISWFISISDAL